MDVRFKTERLLRCYQDVRQGTKEWGEKVARLYVKRVDGLYAAKNAQALRTLRSLDLHALSGERKGQHAIRIDGFYRLIVVFENRAMTLVRIEEVSKHYGD